MKLNLLKSYGGNAVTRQYKRAKHLTYLGAVTSGASFGFASLLNAAGQHGKAFGLGAFGATILYDTINVYKNLFKLSKQYDAIYQRALKIFKHK